MVITARRSGTRRRQADKQAGAQEPSRKAHQHPEQVPEISCRADRATPISVLETETYIRTLDLFLDTKLA